jgi:hypothetical protein
MTLIELQKVLGELISIATDESMPINERKAETHDRLVGGGSTTQGARTC